MLLFFPPSFGRSQSSMNDGSPTAEPVYVRDVEIVEHGHGHHHEPAQPVSGGSGSTPRDIAGASLVRDVPVREEPQSASSYRSSASVAVGVKSRVAFSSEHERNVDVSSSDDEDKRMNSSNSGFRGNRPLPGRVNTERFTETTVVSSGSESVGAGSGSQATPDRSKIQSLRAAFEGPKSTGESSSPARSATSVTTTKRYGIFDTLR